MKKFFLLLAVCALITSCAAMQDPNKYNTQRGAAVGAATGAIAGQAIGHNTTSTLIGAAVGTVAGGLIGNAADQANQQPPPQQNQTQYSQTPTIAPECQKYIGNTGAVDACMRGVNARRAEEDARLADEAYRAGYGNK